MSKSTLLEADRIVNGERMSDYNDPVENFDLIRKIASLLNGVEMTAKQCCNVMIAVKLAREIFKHKRDNIVDTCGYLEIKNRIEEANENHLQ